MPDAASHAGLARAVTAHRRAHVLMVALVLVPLTGCAYLRDRGRDFTDVVDVKGGAGGIGLGVKARATEFVGTGAGVGAVYDTREKFGRRAHGTESAFVGLGVFAMDGRISVCPGEDFEISFLGLRVQDETAPRPWTWFRFGGEAVLPGVRGGLFVNLGEIVDLLAGLVGLDPVGDDGLPLWSPLKHEDERARDREEAPPPISEDSPDPK